MESNADIRQYTDINYLRIAVLLVAFSAVLFFSFGSAVAQVADDGGVTEKENVSSTTADLGLTDEQARKLNWDGDSPETEVTVADMIALYNAKVQASSVEDGAGATQEVFTEPLIDRASFIGPPQNTGELDATLYEDLDGDGDGIETKPTVLVFDKLVRGATEQGNEASSIKSESVIIETVGNTANSTISVDSSTGLASADITVLVNTSVARIVDVYEGSGTGSSELFEVTSQTNDSATIRYTDIQSSLSTGSLAEVELEAQSENGESPVHLETRNVTYIDGSESLLYNVTTNEGALTTAEPPFFDVSNLSPANAEVFQGDNLTVSADVQNTGDEQGTQDIELSVSGNVIASESVTLAGGASENVDFAVSTQGLEFGDYTHTVYTNDDSASGGLTVLAGEPGTREPNQAGAPGDGSVYLGPAGDRPTVFQGEQNIEFINPNTGNVLSNLFSTDGNQRVLEIPIPANEQEGTYTIDGTSSSLGVVLQEPEVTSLEIVNVNGEEVTSVTQGNNILIGVDYNYEVVDSPLVVELYNDQGLEVTAQYVSAINDPNGLTPAQQQKLNNAGYDHFVVANFSDSGNFEIAATADGDDLEEIDTATAAKVVDVASGGEPELQLGQNTVTQGEKVVFDVTNIADGDILNVAIDVGDRRYNNVTPANLANEVFEQVGDTVAFGNISTQAGNFYYAQVEADGTSATGRIDTEFLDDTTVDVSLYSGAVFDIGDADFEEDNASLEVVSDSSEAVATVKSEDVSISKVGHTGNSTISVDAPEGLSTADVTVSINTSVARIANVREGADVNSGDASVLFNVTNQTNDSVSVQYTNIAGTGPVQDFELAGIEFELLSEDADTAIGLSTDNFVYLNGTDKLSYGTVIEEEGNLTNSVFSKPLPIGGPETPPGPPQNIPPEQGGLDDELVEDLDGDGDPTNVGPTVQLFGELIRGNDLGLTDRQARKLNWNPNSPETEVTIADTVSLFGEQVRAD